MTKTSSTLHTLYRFAGGMYPLPYGAAYLQHIRRNRRIIIIGGMEEGVPDGQLSPALHQEGVVQRDDGGPGGGARALCEQLRPRRVVGASGACVATDAAREHERRA